MRVLLQESAYFMYVKKITKFFIACIAMLCMASCTPTAPTCKESYMERFDAFITEVSQNHRTFSDRDWERRTEQFQRFSREWHEKFRDEFTWQDNIAIARKRATWHFFRHYDTIEENLWDFLRLMMWLF